MLLQIDLGIFVSSFNKVSRKAKLFVDFAKAFVVKTNQTNEKEILQKHLNLDVTQSFKT